MTTKKKIPEVKLPLKLSDNIELAVRDLSAVERSKQYQVNMGLWHEGYERPKIGEPAQKCSVCFAGSVIAKTLKAPIEDNVFDLDETFSAHNAARFRALNDVREGDVEYALSQLGRKLPFGMKSDVEVPDYADDAEGFKKTMKQLAKTLRAVGE